MGAQHGLHAAGARARARHRLQLRRRQRPAQPVPRPAVRGSSEPELGRRQAARASCRPTSPRTRSPSRARRARPARAASPTTPRTSATTRRATDVDGAPDDHLHVPHGQARATTAGSASCRARPASSTASAARCRRSATWTASWMSSSDGASRPPAAATPARQAHGRVHLRSGSSCSARSRRRSSRSSSARICRRATAATQADRAGHRQHGHARRSRRPCCVLVSSSSIYALARVPAARSGAASKARPMRGDAGLQIVWIASRRHRPLRSPASAPTRAAPAAARAAGRDRGGRLLPTRPLGGDAAVQVIAQQWEFTYRYPDLRRRRDDRTSCCRRTQLIELHVTSLDVDPLLLGLPARRQGRREPRRRQRRLRQADEDRRPSKCTAPSSAGSGTADMFDHGQVVSRPPRSQLDRRAAALLRARDKVPAAVLDTATSPTPEARRMSAR